VSPTIGARDEGSVTPEIVPPATQIASACLEYRAGPLNGPCHTSLIQTGFDYSLAATLNRATTNLQPALAVGRVVHSVLVVGVVRDGFLDGFNLGMCLLKGFQVLDDLVHPSVPKQAHFPVLAEMHIRSKTNRSG
jgi:hypothetical protein